MKLSFLFFGLFLLASYAQADYPLEIIELKGRPVDEVIPLVRPFVGPDGVVTGMNNQLIIRTSPERLEEIKTILDRFDRPPRRLMILVRHGNAMEHSRQRISGGINSDIGDNANVRIGDPVPHNSIGIGADTRITTSTNDVSHSVLATEGKPAFIASGKSIPITEQQTYISRNRIHQQTTTRYRDATGGFYVVANLNGDQVTLRISTHMDKPAGTGDSIDIQRVVTSITGRLGEWLPIGGIDERSSHNTTGTLRRYSSTGKDDKQVYLLVKEAP